MSHRISRFIEHLPVPDQEDASPVLEPVAKDFNTKKGGLEDRLGYAVSRSSSQNSVSSLIRRLRGSVRRWLMQTTIREK